MDTGPPCAPWCTMQVGGAQCRPMVHNAVLYSLSGAQHSSHKPNSTLHTVAYILPAYTSKRHIATYFGTSALRSIRHISMVSKGVMVLMVKLIDEPSSDERNFSANQWRASQFQCIFLAVSHSFLAHLSHSLGESSWKPLTCETEIITEKM